LCTSMMYAKLC